MSKVLITKYVDREYYLYNEKDYKSYTKYICIWSNVWQEIKERYDGWLLEDFSNNHYKIYSPNKKYYILMEII